MSEDKHTWYGVPARDGDKRQWKRYLQDVELFLETEKLDVDFSHGARLPERAMGMEEATKKGQVQECFL